MHPTFQSLHVPTYKVGFFSIEQFWLNALLETINKSFSGIFRNMKGVSSCAFASVFFFQRTEAIGAREP